MFQLFLYRIFPRRAKRNHLRGKIVIIQKKIWDLEFLRGKLKAMREGFRVEYDALKERLDAASRRLYGEQYQFFYVASNDEIKPTDLPIMVSDIPKLPDVREDTKDFRFYKKPKLNVDKDVCDNLQSYLDKHSEDLEQLRKQLEGLDGQIEGSGGVLELIEGNRTIITLLKDEIRRT